MSEPLSGSGTAAALGGATVFGLFTGTDFGIVFGAFAGALFVATIPQALSAWRVKGLLHHGLKLNRLAERAAQDLSFMEPPPAQPEEKISLSMPGAKAPETPRKKIPLHMRLAGVRR
ncbi:conserved hypothetical protein [Escherichia coli O139:H28 str. E24377A]|uniref:Uncharacterized protein n=1 Tax=Escherichia coli O139:H28 (strain E24377A / ETEC) TaxID=331111 RepID=A7ZL62_ECO24|nr:conserved hypothetical protein [Escherichia coli O139:H28 str. E24377A]